MSETEIPSKSRPVAKVQVGPVHISIWANQGDKGDYYTASAPEIRYRDDKNNEWKTGASFGLMDLLALAEAAREASTRIRELQAERNAAQGATQAA